MAGGAVAVLVVLVALVALAFLGTSGPSPAPPVAGPGTPAAAPPTAPAQQARAMPSSATTGAAAEGDVVYEVTGRGRIPAVTYSSNGTGGMAQENDVPVPFRKQLRSDGGVGVWTLTAQNGRSGGTIGCKITKAGKVVDRASSEGPFAVVTCTGS